MCMALAGCTRKIYIPVETTTYRSDTLHHETLRHDSVALTDSVFLFIKGDTVYKSRTRTRDRYITRTDTLYRARTDTIHEVQIQPIPSTVTASGTTPLTKILFATSLLLISLLLISLLLYKKFRA